MPYLDRCRCVTMRAGGALVTDPTHAQPTLASLHVGWVGGHASSMPSGLPRLMMTLPDILKLAVTLALAMGAGPGVVSVGRAWICKQVKRQVCTVV